MDQNEIRKALETKNEIGKISKSFCAVKWKHATINLGSGSVKSCCHLPFQKINLNNLSLGLQLHETEQDQGERRQMLNGTRPKDCSYCWWVEDNNHLSDRITWSSKSWMHPFIRDLDQKKSVFADPPSWLELNFSSLCNFKCSYCSPIFSSSWTQEIKEFGPYPTTIPHNDINYLKGLNIESEYDRQKTESIFWFWFKDIYPNLRLLKITGGEPLLNKNNFEVLQYIIENPNPNITLSINSNLCIPEKLWDNFITLINKILVNKSVGQFYLHPSIDSFSKRAEYIRHGLDFELFQKHVIDFLQNAKGNIVFISTINNLSLAGLHDLWQWILSLKKRFGKENLWISVTTEVLVAPQWQNINILPPNFSNYLEELILFVKQNIGNDLLSFSEFELLGLERALAVMRKPNDRLREERINFYKFFSEHDRRRKTDFKKTFPELNVFFEESKLIVEKSSEEIIPHQQPK